jgi:hypothetical protein
LAEQVFFVPSLSSVVVSLLLIITTGTFIILDVCASRDMAEGPPTSRRQQ